MKNKNGSNNYDNNNLKMSNKYTLKTNEKKDDRIMLKYFLIGSNIMYTLCCPIFLMCLLYFGLKKYIFGKDQPIILIIFLFLGGITGYWSLIKQLMKLNK